MYVFDGPHLKGLEPLKNIVQFHVTLVLVPRHLVLSDPEGFDGDRLLRSLGFGPI